MGNRGRSFCTCLTLVALRNRHVAEESRGFAISLTGKGGTFSSKIVYVAGGHPSRIRENEKYICRNNSNLITYSCEFKRTRGMYSFRIPTSLRNSLYLLPELKNRELPDTLYHCIGTDNVTMMAKLIRRDWCREWCGYIKDHAYDILCRVCMMGAIRIATAHKTFFVTNCTSKQTHVAVQWAYFLEHLDVFSALVPPTRISSVEEQR